MEPAINLYSSNEKSELIRENSQEILSVLAAHQIALWEYDIITGKCSFSNDYFFTLGLKDAGIIFEDIDDFYRFIHPEDIEFYKQAFAEMLSSDSKTSQIRVRCISEQGKVIWLEDHFLSYKESCESHPGKLLAYTVNVTSQCEKEQHIKYLEEYNRKIIEALPEFIFIFDDNFFITDVLMAPGTILLHPVEVLRGADGRSIYSPEVSDLFICNIRECLRDGKLKEIEYPLEVDGSLHYFQARIAPFEGNRVLALIHDIGDRIQRSQELIEAKRRAEDADKMKSVFLANIHLIKTSMESSFYLPIFLIAGGIIFLIIFFHYVPFFLWLSAKVSGVNISLIQLFLMRIRNVPPYIIVPGMIEAHKAGLKNITRDELEAHYLAGGHVEKVVHALVSASKANIELPFQMATAIDLAGRDVFEAVQMSVNPKVIDTPPVTAVAKDGIQLIAKARVTVRANIRQLVGGAGEDTILARVGEGIVSSIGSSENHKSVLENPDSIFKLVLRKGLDAGTAFEILSIDIADIDIGKNIGAALQIDQANADKNIAQAKAEERRAMAVASEQEMKAKAQEARAKVIEAEAEVPKAMAEAFRSGNLGIMDYYRMKNIEADTSMRENIAKPTTGNAGNQPLSK